jgi:hypothetical protein
MVRQLTSAFTAAAAAVILFTGAAEASDVLVKVAKGGSMKVVLYSDDIDGRLLTVTDASGVGSFEDDFLNAPKGQKVRARVRECPDGSQVLLVAGRANPARPANCRDREAGALVWGTGRTLNVKAQGPGQLIAYTAAAAAGSIFAVDQLRGGEATQRIDKPEIRIETGSGSDSLNLESLSGNYAGSLFVNGPNDCGLRAPANVAVGVKSNASGQVTMTNTHLDAGKTFTHNATLARNGNDGATFTSTITDRVGSRMFKVTDIVSINTVNLALKEIFESLSGDGCRSELGGTLTKQR